MIPLNSNLSPLQRSGIRVYTNLAKATPGCVMLTIGEPDFDTPQPIKDAAWQALEAGQTHYPPNLGVDALRQAVTEYECRRGLPCTQDQVLITVGATGALFTALLGILNPGEEVIIPTPAYSLYDTITRVAGGVPVTLDLKQTGFQITPQALKARITAKTKAIVLNSPNNPTGAVLSEASLQAVKEAVLGKPIFVICDNVYGALSDPACPDLSLDRELKDQHLLCQSFSKPWAMTGWRVGYLLGPSDVMERLLLLHAAEVGSVPTFLQTACITALETDPAPMRRVYRARREYVCRRLDEMGLTYPDPQGAFYVFPEIGHLGLGSEEFCTRMIREARVAAVPGVFFGADDHIRLSYCYSDETLKTALDRMEGFIRSLAE